MTMMGSLPVFPEIDALPGAQRTAPGANRQAQARLGNQRAHVGRHIVRTLGSVAKHRVAVGDQMLHEGLEVVANVRVGVLAQHQRRAGVPAEQLAQAVVQAGLADRGLNLGSQIVRATPAGPDLDIQVLDQRALRAGMAHRSAGAGS